MLLLTTLGVAELSGHYGMRGRMNLPTSFGETITVRRKDQRGRDDGHELKAAHLRSPLVSLARPILGLERFATTRDSTSDFALMFKIRTKYAGAMRLIR